MILVLYSTDWLKRRIGIRTAQPAAAGKSGFSRNLARSARKSKPRYELGKNGRAVFLCMCVFLFVQEGRAQSILNFAYVVQDAQTHTGISVTNPTTRYAEIRFTFYDRTGASPASGMANPVRYRIPPKGQLAMFASDIFQTANLQGWVQATSETAGLAGSYLVGDFNSSLAAGESFYGLSDQVLPLIKEDAVTATEIVIVNPADVPASLSLTLYDSRGAAAASVSVDIAKHALVNLPVGQILPRNANGNYSARLTSKTPLSALTLVRSGQSSVAVAGQPVDRSFPVRFVPGILTPQDVQATLVLANPSPFPITVGLTLFGNGGPILPGLGRRNKPGDGSGKRYGFGRPGSGG
jgi:hypothetical protein